MSKGIDNQLPFIQVAQDVGAKASKLAPLIGVTPQHARGGLIAFWEGLADRRILRKAIEEGGLLIMTHEATQTHLLLAFSVHVEPTVMVALGFLEPMPNGYRIRGMSRYVEAEKTRISKVRKATVTHVAQGCDPGATPMGPGCDHRQTEENVILRESHPTEVRGESLEVIEKRREVEAVSNFLAQQPTQPRQKSAPSYSSDSLRDRMEAAWLKAIGTSYAWTQEDDMAMRPLLGLGSEAEILSRWKRAVVWTGYPSCSRLKDLVKFWNEYAKEQQPQKASGDRARL